MSVACEKSFTLTINAASCPDWTTLLWAVPIEFVFATATASFVPNNTTGAAFDGLADTPNDFFGNAQARNTAGLNYSGTGCNCNLHIVSDVIGGVGSIHAEVTVQQNALVRYTEAFEVTGSGTFDRAFSLVDTLGGTQPILVTVNCQVGIGGPTGVHLRSHLTGTFSNV